MGRRLEELRRLGGRFRGVVLWSALTGVLTGLAVTGFEHAVVEEALPHVLALPIGVIAVLPLVGLAVAALLLRVVARGASPATTDAYLEAFHDQPADLAGRPGFVVPGLLAAVAGELVMSRASVTEYQVPAYDSGS